MNILLVNTSERTGGAAIAANRLMHALNRAGQKANMLVRDRTTTSADVISLPHSPMLKARFIMERAEIFAANGFRKHRLFEVDHASHGQDITRLPTYADADVVHLHWVNQGMLSLSGISHILRQGKPLVWTLHDMWPCTGICHYSRDCRRWQTGCGNCPILRRGSWRDLSYRTFLRKQEAFSRGKIHFVACSDWLADIARRAPLLSGHSVDSIPNAIDTHFYSPQDKQTARRHLGLPANRKILLFVAYKATDPIKGANYFREAVSLLCEKQPQLRETLHAVVVGREATTLREAFPCPASTFEYVSDEHTMRDFYNAADALMMPTLQDNLPNTIVEAMACGLPCVGFNIGGLPQMIESDTNGYLARHKDAADFAHGISQCLDDARHDTLSQGARRKAMLTFSEEAVAARYTEVYERALSDSNRFTKH